MLPCQSSAFQHLFQQRYSGVSAPAQDVHLTQSRGYGAKPEHDVCVLTDAYGPFQQRESPGQVALAEGEPTDSPRGYDTTRRVVVRFGIPQPFFPQGPALGECPQLGMAHGQSGPGAYGWRDRITEALVTPLPLEGCHGLPEISDGPTIVPLGLVGLSEAEVRLRLRDAIAICRGESEGTLASGNGLVIGTLTRERNREKTQDLSQPTRVVEGHSEGFGLTQIRQYTPRGDGHWSERRAQGEPEVDGLLTRVAPLWQMRQGAEGLLEVLYGLAVGRPRHGLLPRLPAVRQGLVPHLASQGMVRQAFDLLCHAVSGVKGLDNTGMQRLAPLLQQAAVGHFVGQGMLEGVLALGKQAYLVEELGGLEVREATLQRLLR